MDKATYWIEKFELLPHPEGGYYKEIYRSKESVNTELLPNDREGERSICTAIYFLLQGNDFSSFHKIKSDEIWHFYDGSDLMVYSINKKGEKKEYLLNKENPVQIIPQNEWFAAELIDKTSFAFVGCTVAPGFDFEDFIMADKDELIKAYPQYKVLIDRLT